MVLVFVCSRYLQFLLLVLESDKNNVDSWKGIHFVLRFVFHIVFARKCSGTSTKLHVRTLPNWGQTKSAVITLHFRYPIKAGQIVFINLWNPKTMWRNKTYHIPIIYLSYIPITYHISLSPGFPFSLYKVLEKIFNNSIFSLAEHISNVCLVCIVYCCMLWFNSKWRVAKYQMNSFNLKNKYLYTSNISNTSNNL